MVFSKNANGATSSRPVTWYSDDDDDRTYTTSDSGGSNSSSSSRQEDTDDYIRVGRNTPGGMSETDDEVVEVSESEFNDQIMRHRKRSRVSSEEEEETDAFSTDSTEEESTAHEQEGLMGIASRTRSRRNKNKCKITETNFSDSESKDVSSYCSFSESDDSDDLDFGSASCSQSQRKGGKKGEKDVARRESLVERVYEEPRGEDLDFVSGSCSQTRRVGGNKVEKHVARRESLVKRVYEEPRGEQNKSKAKVDCLVKLISRGPIGGKQGKHVTGQEQRRKRLDEEPRKKNEKSVGIGNVVAEQVHQEFQSAHEMHSSSSPPCEENKQVNEIDPGNQKGEEVIDEPVENPDKGRKSGSPGEGHSLRRFLLDSLLNEATVFDEEECSEPAFKLPLKFRFEDEVPKPEEKTDFEIELENLYAELNYAWTLDEASSLDQQQVKEDVAESSDIGTSQQQQFCKGKHHFMEDDALGIVCTVCQHIEVEAKHILPPWAEKTYRRAEKRKFPADNQGPHEECIRFPQGVTSRTVFLNPGEGSVWDIKPGVREDMYEHQRDGFEFLWKNLAGSTDLFEIMSLSPQRDVGGCIISHAPGTGKTKLTIMFVETYLKMFPDCRPIIIAPSSMLLTWEAEFIKWEVEFPFHNLGNPEMSGKKCEKLLERLSKKQVHNSEEIRMMKIYMWNSEQSILGMSYNLFAKLIGEKRPTKNSGVENETDPELKKIFLQKPGLVILDEGHIPRNQTSSIWNALQKLRTEKRVVLSGTPFQNNFKELFNVLQVARPSFAISLAKDARFAEMISSNKKKMEKMEQKYMDKAIQDLKTAMAPYVHMYNDISFLQRKLPGLRDFLLILKPLALQKRIIKEMEKPKSTFQLEAKVALVSVHPSLFKPSEKEKLEFEEAALKESRLEPNEGVKTRFVMELVRISMARNEKVLVFSQYIEPLELIQQHLVKAFNWRDEQVPMIKGKVLQSERQTIMASFNDPNGEAKVLLGSTKCCSEGISLVGASRVVLLDVVWNPSVERQAISRAYRIGQKKVVHTYHLMASGTSEVDKYQQQAKKDRLSEMVFAAAADERPVLNQTDEGIEDVVLEEMVTDLNFKNMFEKITCMPKNKNITNLF